MLSTPDTNARFPKSVSLACGAVGLVATLFAFASPANAVLILTANVSGTTFQCIDNAACDTNPAIGQLAFAATTINGVQVTGNFESSVKGPSQDSLSSSATQVTNTSGAARSVIVAVGDTGYIGTTSTFTLSGSGTFMNNQGNAITLRYWADPANAQGGTTATTTQPGTLLDNPPFTFTSTNPTDSFALNPAPIPLALGTPFSMTEEFDFTLAAGASLTARGQVLQSDVNRSVPEPASLALIGTGLVGAGLIRRRKLS